MSEMATTTTAIKESAYLPRDLRVRAQHIVWQYAATLHLKCESVSGGKARHLKPFYRKKSHLILHVKSHFSSPINAQKDMRLFGAYKMRAQARALAFLLESHDRSKCFVNGNRNSNNYNNLHQFAPCCLIYAKHHKCLACGIIASMSAFISPSNGRM